MSQKWQGEVLSKHKRELLIMLALKFGEMNPTMQNQTFGHLAVLLMKWQL